MNMDTASEALAALEHAAGTVRPEDVPQLVGDLERVKLKLELTAQEAIAARAQKAAPPAPDRLLTNEEVADVLGVTPRWVREHAKELPGKVRLPGGQVRYSERKLGRWIERRTT